MSVAKLSTVRRLPLDADGHERLQRLGAIADCPECGAAVKLWQETEEWHEALADIGPGLATWIHSAYGPCQGVCEKCSLLIVDSFDGCRVYDLGKSKDGTKTH